MADSAAFSVLSSFAVVALAEMGDKTQLVAFSLASRFRRPWPVLAGILIATTANHALASWAGAWISARVSDSLLAWALGLGFLVFGVWTLFPDRAGPEAETGRWGPLAATAVIFFFAEMGDKTQLATIALGARFSSVTAVTAGTTLGMLAADGAAVFASTRLDHVIPARLVRRIAAGLFFLFAAGAFWRGMA